MAVPIPITFSVNPANPPQESVGESVQELLNEIADSLSTSFVSTGYIIGQLNGVLPTHNVGPWANGDEWWVWNAASGVYQRATDSVPIGIMAMWGGQGAPTNWLLCDGSEISRTQYAALFQVLGGTWGAGDNVTTFNLPCGAKMFMSSPGFSPASDVPIDSGYAGNGVGGRGGSQLAPLLTTANLPAMQCRISYATANKANPRGIDYGYALPQANSGQEYWIYEVSNNNGARLGQLGQTQIAVMPPFVACNYIIKCQ